MTKQKSPSIGVLLVHLGTPDSPTPEAVKRYLRELLSDPRMVELPRYVWWPILHGIILPFRAKKSAKLYQEIWSKEGSPLLINAQKQADKLIKRLEQKFDGAVVGEIGMCCGNPSMKAAWDKLKTQGVKRILLLPLSPQYTSAAGGSAFSSLIRTIGSSRVLPELRTIMDFHDHPGYIAALACGIKSHWGNYTPGEKLLISFHGLPRKYVSQGDPYAAQCCRTVELLVQSLGLEKDRYIMTFQSRFGPGQWLKPYTDETLRDLAKSGVQTLDVVCPGFAVDCLETLHEIAIDYRDRFVKAGGKELRYIPALNDADEFIDALEDIVSSNLLGWL